MTTYPQTGNKNKEMTKIKQIVPLNVKQRNDKNKTSCPIKCKKCSVAGTNTDKK